MRQAAEEASVGESRLHSVKGSDNDTTLESLSINLITAAQAFHWFDPTAFRAECERILKPGGSVALLWNERLDDTTEFAREYEQLLQQFSTDYQEVDHRSVGREKMDRFWRPGEEVIERSFPHTIHMTREGMHGRVRSSSYVPAPGKPGHEEMCAALNALFDREQQGGTVPYHYACKIYFARLR
jgi:SAM-dependent methyltransferase